MDSTNDNHVNFRIVTADPKNPEEWSELVGGSERTYLRGLTSHREHLLIAARVDGLDQLLLRDYATGKEERVPFDEASYSASFTGNPEYAPRATASVTRRWSRLERSMTITPPISGSRSARSRKSRRAMTPANMSPSA